MKILFLSDNFPPETNAPATRLWEHAVRWVRLGHEVTVITCAPNFPEGRLFPGYRNAWRTVEWLEGIRVVRVKTYITANEGFVKRTLDYLSFMLAATVASAFEARPGVVVATSPQIFCAAAGWFVSVLKWRPFVFELRDLWPASIVAVGAMKKSMAIRALETFELFLYRRAACVVAVTESFRADLAARGIPAEKIRVVLNGVDLETYSPRARNERVAAEFGLGARFIAGYMGTLGMAHALPKVLEAAERLRHRTDIGFFMAGSGAERGEIERMIAERRLGNVRLIPRQPKERMPDLWSLCDVALVPLRNTDVFATVIPSKIFEAMGMGVPVLMSVPEGEATTIVRRTGVGLCIPPEDAEAMAAALQSLADDPARVDEFRQAARRAAPQFSRDFLASQMARLLDDVGRTGLSVGPDKTPRLPG